MITRRQALGGLLAAGLPAVRRRHRKTMAWPGTAEGEGGVPVAAVNTGIFNLAFERGMSVSGAEVVPNDSQPASQAFSNVTTGTVNTNYRYEGVTSAATHNHLTFGYLVSRGWKTVKIHTRWERLTRNSSALTPGTLNTSEMALLDTEIAEAGSQGLGVVIDLHNYGQYYADGAFIGLTAGTGFARHLGETTGSVVWTTAFTSFWSAMAARYLGNPAVIGFHIMNEPNNSFGGTPKLTQANWYAAAQAAVNAIRAVDVTGRFIIRVGGWAFSSVGGWAGNNPVPFITDPVAPQNTWYEGHHYFDPNGAGDYTSQNYAAAVTDAQNRGFTATYNGVTYPDAVYSKVLHDLDAWKAWLDGAGARGVLGEVGTPDFNYVTAGDVVSWTGVLGVYLAHVAKIGGVGIDAWSCGELYSGFNTALQIYGASNFFTSGVDNPGPVPQVAPTWEAVLS